MAIRSTAARLSLQVVDAFDPANVLLPPFYPSPADKLRHLLRFLRAKLGQEDLQMFAHSCEGCVGVPLQAGAPGTLEQVGFRGACTLGVTTTGLYETYAARQQRKNADRKELRLRIVDDAGNELVARQPVDRSVRLKQVARDLGLDPATASLKVAGALQLFSRRQMFLRLWHLRLEGDVDLEVQTGTSD